MPLHSACSSPWSTFSLPRVPDVRSHAAASPSHLDRPLLSHRPSTAPINGRHTLQHAHHSNNQDGLDSARCPLPRPYANTSFAPRCLSSRGSSRPSSAATNGTIEVYDFAYRSDRSLSSMPMLLCTFA